MPTSPIVQALLALSVLNIAFSLWKGGTAERLAAVCVTANLGVGLVSPMVFDGARGMAQFTNDGLTALALLAITLRYAAPWTIGAMFFYAAQFSLHAYYITTGRNDRDYLHAVINNLNFLGVQACLVIGAAMAWRDRIRARAPAPVAAPASRAPRR